MGYEPLSDSERIADAVDGVRIAIDAIELPDVTLRDLFACVALHRLMMVDPRTMAAELVEEDDDENITGGEVIAREAYRLADEMLKARAK